MGKLIVLFWISLPVTCFAFNFDFTAMDEAQHCSAQGKHYDYVNGCQAEPATVHVPKIIGAKIDKVAGEMILTVRNDCGTIVSPQLQYKFTSKQDLPSEVYDLSYGNTMIACKGGSRPQEQTVRVSLPKLHPEGRIVVRSGGKYVAYSAKDFDSGNPLAPQDDHFPKAQPEAAQSSAPQVPDTFANGAR